MALTLEEALSELGILKGKIGPLEAERDRLLGSKEKLETDVAKLRDRAQTAETERDEFRGKVPADGSVTLSKADGERWQAYTALGKVDQLKTSLERMATLEAEKGKNDRYGTIRGVELDPEKLETFLRGKSLKVEGEGEGRKVSVVLDDKELAFSEWAESEKITDLVNSGWFKLNSTARPVVMSQAGNRTQQTQDTWSQAANDRFGVKK